jgi:acyl-CoA thioesterase-1
MIDGRSGFLICAGLAAALLALSGAARAEERADECYAPASVRTLGAPLEHTGSLLLLGEPVKIVAFGSSSTAGAGASDPSRSYPSQLALELKQRFPKSRVTVLNKGINGEQSKEMLARLERDVLAEHPDLVIWQTGSNEILRKGNPEQFRQRVLDGLARIKAAGIETILIDAQYAPRILANPEYSVFNDVLRKIAHAARVALFDRFEAMRYWLTSGRQAPATMVSKDQVHMTDASYRCLAQQIASLIAADLPAVAAR